MNYFCYQGEEEDDDAEDPLQAAGSAASDDDNLKEAIKRGSGESESESSSGSATSSSSKESDKYPLRQRRAATAVNYNFTEYDELMKSAIQVCVQVSCFQIIISCYFNFDLIYLFELEMKNN
jgi:hypothetical protein